MQQGPFARRTLLRFVATTNLAAPVSPSADFPGDRLYDRPAPSIARWDEDGFSSCSTCPCHRAAPNHPAGVTGRFVSARPVMLPSPRPSGLGLRSEERRVGKECRVG